MLADESGQKPRRYYAGERFVECVNNRVYGSWEITRTNQLLMMVRSVSFGNFLGIFTVRLLTRDFVFVYERKCIYRPACLARHDGDNC